MVAVSTTKFSLTLRLSRSLELSLSGIFFEMRLKITHLHVMMLLVIGTSVINLRTISKTLSGFKEDEKDELFSFLL